MSKKDFKLGSLVVCMDNTGLEEYGIVKGQAFSVASEIIVPGQGEFLTIVNPDLVGDTAKDKKIFVVDAKNFSPASVYYVRVWPETGKYEFVDEIAAQEKCPEDDFFLVSRITLPDDEVKNMEVVLQTVFNTIKEKGIAKTTEVAATD